MARSSDWPDRSSEAERVFTALDSTPYSRESVPEVEELKMLPKENDRGRQREKAVEAARGCELRTMPNAGSGESRVER